MSTPRSSSRDRAPDVLGEIMAFRAWEVETVWGAGDRYRLLSLSGYPGDLWPTGAWMEAECDSGCVEIPGDDCSCGIYAAKHRRHLVRLGYNRRGSSPRVIGDVALAGKVVPGEKGWRAERARVVRLYVPYELWELVGPLREDYKIPVGLDNLLRY